MKIGIDTDGVLTDMASYLQKMGRYYLNREPSDTTAYNVEDIFCTSKWEKMRYGIPLFVNYCKKCPPREGTKRVIEKLNKEGYELHEVTARKFVTMKNPLGLYSKKLLLKWYKKHGLEFKSIVFCSEKNTGVEKTNACLNLNIKIMVEDRPEIAVKLAEDDITVLLFDAPYNQNCSGERIVRCFSWDDVYKQIKSLTV